MARYGFAIDTVRCVGCNNCSLTCKVENNLPNEIWWNRAMTVGGEEEFTAGADSNGSLYLDYYTLSCQHCENPACVKVCPVGATWKDEETGIVRQDYDKCLGCRMCMAACPYTGVRSFNWEEPAYELDFAVGDASVPAHEKHAVEKCVMCYHRINAGERPACVDICRAGARFWGDLDDPTSEVSQIIAKRAHKQLLPEMGTKPSVYYLV